MAFETSQLSSQNVLRDVHDTATQSLRTTATAVIPPGQFEVSIDHTDDSIRLGDGTILFTGTTVGAKTGLDVNILNPIKLTDGTDSLSINSDGSLNVNIVSSGANFQNIFNEVTNIASGVTSTVINHVSSVNTYLQQVMVSGVNPGMYELLVNSVVLAKQYTYYTSLNTNFNFSRGLLINNGDVIQLKATHNQPNLGSFNGNLIFMG